MPTGLVALKVINESLDTLEKERRDLEAGAQKIFEEDFSPECGHRSTAEGMKKCGNLDTGVPLCIRMHCPLLK